MIDNIDIAVAKREIEMVERIPVATEQGAKRGEK